MSGVIERHLQVNRSYWNRYDVFCGASQQRKLISRQSLELKGSPSVYQDNNPFVKHDCRSSFDGKCGKRPYTSSNILSWRTQIILKLCSIRHICWCIPETTLDYHLDSLVRTTSKGGRRSRLTNLQLYKKHLSVKRYHVSNLEYEARSSA
jgi:hypothetical protein